VVLGAGIDLVETRRMSAAYERHGPRLVGRICTASEAAELSASPEPVARLSATFAAKEAVMKALGTGMRGVGWQEIQTGQAGGAIEGLLSGRALERARRLGAGRFSLSISVSVDVALAAVLLLGEGGC
jgi:holo-[acyl-carrier protein] synthase